MFGELKKHVAAFFADMSLKKLIIIALVALCILFPTILAISNAIYTTVKSSEPEDTPTVIIYDADGNELFREIYEKDYSGDASLVNIFLSIKNNMEKTSPITTETATENPLVAEIIESKGVTKLTCYFSFTHGSSYCVDVNGQYYKIPSTYSDFFLSSSFAELLYTDATPPLLRTADEQRIVPETASWKYKSIDNSFKTANLIKTTADVITYDISGGISLDFERKPDACSVTVHDGEELIFNGTLEELEKITLDTSTELLLSVKADWLDNKGRLYNGSVTYRFKIIIHNRSELSVSSTTLPSDGFVLLKATNISNPSRLTVTLPDSTDAPTAYYIGGTAYVAIPYPDGFEGDVYTVNASYGVSAKTFELALDGTTTVTKDKAYATLEALSIDTDLFSCTNTDRIFLTGLQRAPSELGYTGGSVFGGTILTGAQLQTSPFMGYKVDGGSGLDIRSSVSGRVCATGENQKLGKFMAIDCGLGIKLWYFGFSQATAELGDHIAVGDVLGMSDRLVFEDGEGFYIMATCNDAVIDPKYVFEITV